ncbi:MAG: ethanolamine ammonia-lyase subunit EutC [Oscillospiraceae bacterium]|nr:ethanolamine ammonia-lyase subunit EutC [Oscillospiraceae bacterium]
MDREELKRLVAQLLQERAPEKELPGEDLTQVELRKLYLVEQPKNPEAFLRLKAKTPARLGMGRAGTRYRTQTLLRFRADHAAAQDSVFSQVPEDFPKANGLLGLQTLCKEKEEYLTRPDLGRRFSQETGNLIREVFAGQRILLVVGDGLSANAITENAMDCLQAIRQGLKAKNLETGQPIFVRYCRVGASDHLGELTGCELVCLLVGERPGLVTNASMSAYLTYKPHLGTEESERTVISNIHSQGIAPVEAGAHIAAVIGQILQKKKSGVAFAGEAGQ